MFFLLRCKFSDFRMKKLMLREIVPFFTQGVAIGLGYKWFSTIRFLLILYKSEQNRRYHALKVQYNPAQWQRLGVIYK